MTRAGNLLYSLRFSCRGRDALSRHVEIVTYLLRGELKRVLPPAPSLPRGVSSDRQKSGILPTGSDFTLFTSGPGCIYDKSITIIVVVIIIIKESIFEVSLMLCSGSSTHLSHFK